MHRYWWIIAVGLAGAVPMSAQDQNKQPPAKEQEKDKKEEPKLPLSEKFEKELKEFQDSRTNFMKLVNEMRAKKLEIKTDNPEIKKYLDEQGKLRISLQNAARELAKTEPASAVGFKALTYLIENQVGSDEIYNQLAKHHAAKTGITKSLVMMQYGRVTDASISLLREISEKNTTKIDKARATLLLGMQMTQKKDPQAEATLDKFLATYGKDEDKEIAGMVKNAEGTLFEARHLAEGKPVPDIIGEDTDGVKFKLSDYKGKVVMLDFWAHW